MFDLDIAGGIVKVVWRDKNGCWTPILKLTREGGYREVELVVGDLVEFEVVDSRVCTGYYSDIGRLVPCPETRDIVSGSQCFSCRERDVYSDYVIGRSAARVDADFSVYLVQAGSQVKVGVTRSDKLVRRWLEQGGDYGVEVRDGLSSMEALDLEKKISREHGVSQTIRKEEKLIKKPCKLDSFMGPIGVEGRVLDLQEIYNYPDKLGRKLVRKGRFAGEIYGVKGQLISNGDLCIALTSGKKIIEPSQTALDSF
ncbi:DUF2797 domain-containing protein [Methanonatronarchaeum thermophilum]|uniref:DUF2797 domain-containing protein n=1 Tax=Methanonatronarchaeum thermophilum TaxID=1927129 RepID=UPI001374766A|nr:DUF2797 domain-containing protein [Methanonatronarchaeum thermophilum]